MPDATELARMIGDKFVLWQGPSGRPDGAKCPFVTPGRFGSTQCHSPLYLGTALYRLYEKTDHQPYKDAADRYVIFMMCFPRNPVEPDNDRRRNAFYEDWWEMGIAEKLDPRLLNNVLGRCAHDGWGLRAYAQFQDANPDDDCFEACAEGFYDWLKFFETDLGHAYNIGYPPSNCSDPGITDGAFTGDLVEVAHGLVDYYRLSRRPEVLANALRLADYYLRPHEKGTARGAFVESLGTWCIGPWPVEVAAEHLPLIRMDESGWGFSATDGVRFLTKLDALLPDSHGRLSCMKQRCCASVRWQLVDCQFDDGAVGMTGQDDKWMGMTAGAILAYLALRDAGWLDAKLLKELAPRAQKAARWLVENVNEQTISDGGFISVTGQTQPHPPENLAWLLAWTVEALLRHAEVLN